MSEMNLNRTDLIDESEQIASLKPGESGIVVEESEHGRVLVKKVVVDEQASEKTQKKLGEYVTLTVPMLHVEDDDGIAQLQTTLTEQLKLMHEQLEIQQNQKILVIGLGNKTITPDAVGPLAIDVIQTLDVPQFIMYAPGVTGQTGLETKAFVEALVDHVKPSLVIVIDALATKSTKRLCKTIQLTNTGIHPGSGVGNMRQEIAYETLGVPVTAIGVPTVVDATVLLADAVNMLFRTIAAKIDENNKPSSKLSIVNWSVPETFDATTIRPIFGEWTAWSEQERYQLLEEVLHVQQRLIVSPKEIDLWNNCYSELIGNSLAEWLDSFGFSS